jgi:hypothetical protein
VPTVDSEFKPPPPPPRKKQSNSSTETTPSEPIITETKTVKSPKPQFIASSPTTTTTSDSNDANLKSHATEVSTHIERIHSMVDGQEGDVRISIPKSVTHNLRVIFNPDLSRYIYVFIIAILVLWYCELLNMVLLLVI